jgi:hypothetical protein
MSSNFAVYVIGFIVVIIGLAYGAHLAGVPPAWIGVGVIILIGLAILRGVTKTQSKAPPS